MVVVNIVVVVVLIVVVVVLIVVAVHKGLVVVDRSLSDTRLPCLILSLTLP